MDHFETTPPISTYLVACLVGELKKSAHDEDSPVYVYANGDYLAKTKYVLEQTPMLFETMENYTDSPFSTKKIDFLAIPDLGTGATENWGLYTFRYVHRSFVTLSRI